MINPGEKVEIRQRDSITGVTTVYKGYIKSYSWGEAEYWSPPIGSRISDNRVFSRPNFPDLEVVIEEQYSVPDESLYRDSKKSQPEEEVIMEYPIIHVVDVPEKKAVRVSIETDEELYLVDIKSGETAERTDPTAEMPLLWMLPYPMWNAFKSASLGSTPGVLLR